MAKKKKNKSGGQETPEALSNVTPFSIKPTSWFQEPEDEEEDWDDDEFPDDDLPGGYAPYMMDRAVRFLDERVRKTTAGGQELPDDFLDRMMTDREFLEEIETRVPDSPEAMAGELTSLAAFSEDELQQRMLFRAALMLDPDNLAAGVDAATHDPLPVEERLEKLRGLARRAELKGSFPDSGRPRTSPCTLADARAFLNASLALVDILVDANRLDEAIEVIENALRTDPNDIANFRERLLALNLAKKRLEDARRLLKDLDEDDGAAFVSWSRVLERFLSNDLAGAAKAYRQANRDNSKVRDYLTGKKPWPLDEEEYWFEDEDPDEEEAVAYMECFAVAWNAHPEAREWLKGVSAKGK